MQAKGRHADALAHLRACAEGPYASDRAMLTSLAQAAGAAFDAAVKRLDTVEAHCRYGDHLGAAGRADAARAQYEAVLSAARVAPDHARELNREWIERANSALAALTPR